MSALLLPFALRTVDGQFVSPEEVIRGLACNCVCPGCGHPVQARHGTERVWHFAHAKASDCAGAYEKSVHEAAKQMLRDRKELLLPAVAVTVASVDAFSRLLQEQKTVLPPQLVSFESCLPGQQIGNVAPDLVGVLHGRRLLIEVTVFHRLMPDKAQRLKQTGLAVLELDLSELKTTQATRAKLEEALFEHTHNRRWVHHPAQAQVERELTAKLQHRLEAANSEWEAQEKKAQAAREAHRIRQAQHEAQIADRSKYLAPSTTAIWRAGFPPEERWAPARAAFAARHQIPSEKVQAVMGTITKRSELARTTPEALAIEWAQQFSVTPEDIRRYFDEAGYEL